MFATNFIIDTSIYESIGEGKMMKHNDFGCVLGENKTEGLDEYLQRHTGSLWQRGCC